MNENIGTLAILLDNATLLSEHCFNCRCFGFHMLIVFVCTASTQKKQRRKVKHNIISHRTQKRTGQNHWHLVKIVRNNSFLSMWFSCHLYLDTAVSNRCGQYSNHTYNQLKWRKCDSTSQKTLRNGYKKSPGEFWNDQQWVQIWIPYNTVERSPVRRRHPSNPNDLEEFAKEEWSKITVERCKKVIHGSRKRLISVILSKGGATKY